MAFDFRKLLGLVADDPNAGGVAPVDVAVPRQGPRSIGGLMSGMTPNVTPATPQEAQPALPVHKGAFGQKGTLRDILGTIGDAFLVQSGQKPIYAPKREQEKIGDALQGFNTGSDKHQLEVLDAVNQIDPAFGQKLYDTYLTNIYRQKQQQSLDDNRRDMQDDRSERRRQAEDAAAALQEYRSTTTNMTAEHNRAMEDIARTNAKANTTRADRTTQPRSQRAQTELEFFQSIDKIPEDKRTAGQKDFYKKFIEGTGKRGRTGTIKPPTAANAPASGGMTVRRNGKWVAK